MSHDQILLGAISLGLIGLATMLAGRFSHGLGFTRRYRQAALLGIRGQSGSKPHGQSRFHR